MPTIADLSASLRLDASRFTSGVSGALSEVARFSTAISRLQSDFRSLSSAASAVQPLAAGLRNLADAIGVSREALQGFQTAFGTLGVSAGTLQSAFTTLEQKSERLAAQFASGKKFTSDFAQTLNGLGISAKGFVNLPLDQKINALADAFARAGPSSQSLVQATTLLGSSGTQMAAGLQQGTSGLQSMSTQATAAASSVGSVVAPIVAVVAALAALSAVVGKATSTLITLSDKIRLISVETGLSMDKAQAMTAAFEAVAGGGISVARVFDQMQRNLEVLVQEMDAGGTSHSQFARALGELHINIRALNDLNADERFNVIASALSNLSDKSKVAALSMEVLGRGAYQIVPLFLQGPDAVEKYARKIEEANASVKDVTPEVLKLHAAATSLNIAWQGLSITIGKPIVNIFTNLADSVAKVLIGVNGLLRRLEEWKPPAWLDKLATIFGAIAGAAGTVATVVSEQAWAAALGSPGDPDKARQALKGPQMTAAVSKAYDEEIGKLFDLRTALEATGHTQAQVQAEIGRAYTDAQTHLDAAHAAVENYIIAKAKESETNSVDTKELYKHDQAFRDLVDAQDRAVGAAAAVTRASALQEQQVKKTTEALSVHERLLKSLGDVAVGPNIAVSVTESAASVKSMQDLTSAYVTAAEKQRTLVVFQQQWQQALNASKLSANDYRDVQQQLIDAQDGVDASTKAVLETQRALNDQVRALTPAQRDAAQAAFDHAKALKDIGDAASAVGRLTAIQKILHDSASDAKELQTSIKGFLDLINQPSQEENTFAAKRLGLETDVASWQSRLAGSSDLAQAIASIQHQIDEAIRTGQPTDALQRQLNAALAQVKDFDANAVIAGQKRVDAESQQITALQAKENELAKQRQLQAATVNAAYTSGSLSIRDMTTATAEVLKAIQDAGPKLASAFDPLDRKLDTILGKLGNVRVPAYGAPTGGAPYTPGATYGPSDAVLTAGVRSGSPEDAGVFAGQLTSTATGGGALLPASWYAAIQGHESTLPLPGGANGAQPMFGIIPEFAAQYGGRSVGTGYYRSGGTPAASASLNVAAGTTRQALFPNVSAGVATLDDWLRAHPQLLPFIQNNDFPGFINALAPLYAGPGEAAPFASQVIGAFNPQATLPGIGAAAAVPTAAVRSAAQFSRPAPASAIVTQPFGPTDVPGEPGGRHAGIDYGQPGGVPFNVSATAAGQISEVSGSINDTVGYGLHVIEDLGNGLTVLYGHLQRADVQVGQMVQAGETLGLSGSSGFSTGNHLHFEVRRNGVAVDPSQYLNGTAAAQAAADSGGAPFGAPGGGVAPYDVPSAKADAAAQAAALHAVNEVQANAFRTGVLEPMKAGTLTLGPDDISNIQALSDAAKAAGDALAPSITAAADTLRGLALSGTATTEQLSLAQQSLSALVQQQNDARAMQALYTQALVEARAAALGLSAAALQADHNLAGLQQLQNQAGNDFLKGISGGKLTSDASTWSVTQGQIDRAQREANAYRDTTYLPAYQQYQSALNEAQTSARAYRDMLNANKAAPGTYNAEQLAAAKEQAQASQGVLDLVTPTWKDANTRMTELNATVTGLTDAMKRQQDALNGLAVDAARHTTAAGVAGERQVGGQRRADERVQPAHPAQVTVHGLGRNTITLPVTTPTLTGAQLAGGALLTGPQAAANNAGVAAAGNTAQAANDTRAITDIRGLIERNAKLSEDIRTISGLIARNPEMGKMFLPGLDKDISELLANGLKIDEIRNAVRLDNASIRDVGSAVADESKKAASAGGGGGGGGGSLWIPNFQTIGGFAGGAGGPSGTGFADNSGGGAMQGATAAGDAFYASNVLIADEMRQLIELNREQLEQLKDANKLKTPAGGAVARVSLL